jgi:CheY-like chemotaxis protein
MSHEIRTPLNAILGFAEILKSSEKDIQKIGYFDIIKSSEAMLLTIVNDILDFSKIESGRMLIEKRKFPTKKPFKELGLVFYERAKEKKINLKIVFDENLPEYFVGDEIRIKQVASNFLSNAIKFTHENGHIIMSISYDFEQNRLKFSVKDNGIGIDKKNLEKIFESFMQEDISTTRKYGGTGLGLSISSALVKSMDGDINVTSNLGEGSEFSFSIPYPTDYKYKIDQPSVEFLPEKKLNATVLLVEDNKTNQILMKVMLKDLNIDVDIVSNGKEAIEKFIENKYDLILMDENMPLMSGIEATRIILDLEKENGVKHTPIIAVTANALATDKDKFLNAGMDNFISKPIDHEHFVKVLKMYL